MSVQIENTIERLLHNGNVVKNIVELEFKNIYKHDKDFTYVIDKDNQSVHVSYKDVKYTFPLPLITFRLKPPVSWLFFKETYIHEMVNTFKLQYCLAMYYTACIHTHYKNNTNIKIIKEET